MIGFLDSGIGGVSILNACKDVLVGQGIIFLCDNKNLPYSTKTKKYIQKISLSNAKCLEKHGAKIIVLACNTATICAIDFLRKKCKNSYIKHPSTMEQNGKEVFTCKPN